MAFRLAKVRLLTASVFLLFTTIWIYLQPPLWDTKEAYPYDAVSFPLQKVLRVPAKSITETLNKAKIFVVDLPPEFNSDIAKAIPSKNGDCIPTEEFGCQQGVQYNMDDYRYCETNQFTSEVIFHQALLQSRYRVLKMSEANLIYFPFYSGLHCWLFNPEGTLQLNTAFREIIHQMNIPNGVTPFMALGKVQQEMSSPRCNLLSLDDGARKMAYLLIETVANKLTHLTRHVIPYPSWFHRDNSIKQNFKTNQAVRDIFAYIAGSRKSGLRPILIDAISLIDESGKLSEIKDQRKYARLGFYDRMGAGECHGHQQMKNVTRWMRRAVFCPQPAGDTPTRKSFYDALIAGCIPVIFDSRVAYPYDNIIDYTEITVYLPGDKLINGQMDLFTSLLEISQSRIEELQTNIRSVRHLLQYSLIDSSPERDLHLGHLDAIDVAVYQILSFNSSRAF